jgi:hypothetical protein
MATNRQTDLLEQESRRWRKWRRARRQETAQVLQLLALRSRIAASGPVVKKTP